MTSPKKLIGIPPSLVLVLTGIICVVGCNEKKSRPVEVAAEESTGYFANDSEEVPELAENRLSNEPTDFLRARTKDAINWQPWSPVLLEQAERSQRPIFAFIVSGKFPHAIPLLDELSDPDQKFVKELNENYVCTLVDLEAHPELSALISILCSELRKPVSLPFFLWMSHEGNPIAWLPIFEQDRETFSKVLDNSHSLIVETWENSQEYAVSNSRLDNVERLKREELAVTDITLQVGDQADFLVEQISQLTSLYDPASQSIDSSGGLVPTGYLRFLGQMTDLPALPDFLRSRCLGISEEMSKLLASQPITDPISKGLYSTRATPDWSIPRFMKDLKTQSEMAMVYARSHSLSGTSLSPSEAIATLTFAKNEFGQGEEGFGSYRGLSDDLLTTELFLLPYSTFEELLSPEEFETLRYISSLSPQGNIPAEVDPKRKFFRKNILGEFKTTAEAAVELGLAPDDVEKRLNSALEKLGGWREERAEKLEAMMSESTRVTEWNALHAHSLLVSGRLLNKPELIEEGRSLLQFLKRSHYDQFKGLWRIPPQDGRRGVKARGRDYASLLAALLESYRSELDSSDLVWAEAIARESIRSLKSDDGRISEAPEDEIPMNIPLYNRSMIFGESTWGVILGAYEYLGRLTINSPFPEFSEEMTKVLHVSASRNPMNHSDYLSSLVVPISDCVAIIHGESSDPEVVALHQHLLAPKYAGVVLVRPDVLEKSSFADFAEIPQTSGVSLYRSESKVGTASTPEELETLLGTVLDPR